ncbi:MAG: hypothetical protein SNJ60_03100 [Pseudanabaenaceae cyanobacterium]
MKIQPSIWIAPLLLTLGREAAIACEPLPVVGGTGTTQIKTVSMPSVPFLPFLPFVSIQNNWNTDFVVPGGQPFRRFRATNVPEQKVRYDIQVNLKYADGTHDQSFQQSVDLQPGQTFAVEAVPRANNVPFQVNVLVGGVEQAIDTTYRLTAYGCLQERQGLHR